MSHTLWIPIVFPGMNDIIELRGKRRGKWDKWSQTKATLSDQIGLLAKRQDLEIEGPAYFTYLHFEPNRRRDPSNFTSAAQKIIEDALQKAGILQGDGWRDVLGFRHWWQVSRDPGVFLVVADRSYCDSEALQIFRSRVNSA